MDVVGTQPARVNGAEKVGHWGGGIVYHRHDEKGLKWEPGGVMSGAGVWRSGVSQESSGSSETWEAAFCRLCRRRQLSPFISRMWTWWVRRSSSGSGQAL